SEYRDENQSNGETDSECWSLARSATEPYGLCDGCGSMKMRITALSSGLRSSEIRFRDDDTEASLAASLDLRPEPRFVNRSEIACRQHSRAECSRSIERAVTGRSLQTEKIGKT